MYQNLEQNYINLNIIEVLNYNYKSIINLCESLIIEYPISKLTAYSSTKHISCHEM